MNPKILEARDLTVCFNLRGKILTAIRGVDLEIYEQEVLSIVGESGSGKSVLTKTFLGMTDKNGWIERGSLLYKDHPLHEYKKEKDWLRIRGKEIAMVFQDPMSALNPLKKVGEQIRESLVIHRSLKEKAQIQEAMALMEKVGIPDAERRYHQYPYEFSGGMRQRIVIATALACNPKILICDEPTTALDVTLQAQILKILKELQRAFGLTIVFITHDLGVVANIADRVAVMYAGEVVEQGASEDVFYRPTHPYTQALLQSLPQLGRRGDPLFAIRGTPPSLFQEIKGDAFAPRNPKAMKIDFLYPPPSVAITESHTAKTWALHPMALKKHGPPAIAQKAPSLAREPAFTATTAASWENRKKVLQLQEVSVAFGNGRKRFRAVQEVSFDIYKGETVSLVGESGSGKTTLGRAIMKIVPTSGGQIFYENERVNQKMSKEALKRYRQKVQMIFQDPMASLNERAKVDYIISEGLYNFKLFRTEQERKEKVERIMAEVGLLPEFASRFPHEFSGGQRQRLGIARALILNPELVIADEPISALDVSIRAQVINLLNRLKKERDLTYLFIAHDLSVVRFISDRIAVIYKGQIVEWSESEELFQNPAHPYTQALLSAIPMPDPRKEKQKQLLTYEGSNHHGRTLSPHWTEISANHFVLATDSELETYAKQRKRGS